MRRRSVLVAAGALLSSTAATGRAVAAPATAPVLDHRTETAYDGRTYTDLSAQAGAVKVLKSGTILVTFRTTSRAQAMTLLSASDPTHTASNITLSVSAGALQFSARDKGVLQDNHLTRTMYDDGEWHTAAVTVSGGTTTFYADGRPVHSVASGTFFSKVSGLTSLNIARNVDSDHPGGEWFFTGGIRRVAVYQHALTKQQVAEQSVRVDLADFGRIATILNSDTPATWVVTGDSITHGALWTNGWRSYVEHFQERVRWELGKPKNSDFVLDTGVSGSTTNDLTAKFAERVAAFSPRVVSVMLGTNDVATPGIGVAVYRANLLKLIASIRVLPGRPIPLLQTPNPINTGTWPGREALADYAQTMRDVAKARDVVLVDHFARWTADYGSTPPANLLGDGLHPNGRGHLLMAHTMIKALRIFDPTSRVGKLTIP
ncbi:GDSL-type esterase/lipase family protein [Streptomyces sp. NBC_00841]|uniref:GDSL-type esterase/lipase family protein n=1 Tax=Streptomyces sp. NBC_00841 TaxID=2975847 RepID=UPI002DDB9DD9|nr:GDSL-type esterase/lipase family protein [Streptomyces sp. NBC_00841]WRZ97088.1 GDSL-type esterase/lipase family protein [Streptomyces sp. NBC_00841]